MWDHTLGLGRQGRIYDGPLAEILEEYLEAFPRLSAERQKDLSTKCLDHLKSTQVGVHDKAEHRPFFVPLMKVLKLSGRHIVPNERRFPGSPTRQQQYQMLKEHFLRISSPDILPRSFFDDNGSP